jgi:Glycosyl transferase family 2
MARTRGLSLFKRSAARTESSGPDEPVEAAPPPGFAERIRPDIIEGWAHGALSDAAVFELVTGNCSVRFEPERWLRHDVAGVHGASFLNSGFRWIPDPVARSVVEASLRAALPVGIRVNGTLLPAVDPLAQSPEAMSNDVLPAEAAHGASRAYSWGLFRIEGVAAPDALISIRAGTRDLDCLVTRGMRPDPDAVVDAFEVEIPPEVWSGSEPGEPVSFELLFDGTVVTQFKLDAALLSRWLLRLAALRNPQDRQYLGLLALEHVRASGMQAVIDPQALETLMAIAVPLRLQDFGFPSGLPARAVSKGATESPSALAMRRAMLDLNGTLARAGPDAPLAGIVSEVLSRQGLAGEAHVWFSFLVTQIACDRGEFVSLVPLLDQGFLAGQAGSGGPDHLSLSLPALLAGGKVREAAVALGELAHKQRAGWVHTSCIRYALEESRRMLHAGLARAADVRLLREAFITFADQTNGEWFSRHHDLQIVRAMAGEVCVADAIPDCGRAQLESAAIRNFGLCPAFWAAMEEQPDTTRFHGELGHARRLWQDVRAAVQEPAPHRKELAAAGRALRWFLHRGNRDALVVAREILANALPQACEDAPDALAGFSELLLAHAPEERLRPVFLPGVTEQCLHTLMPELPLVLERTLRLASDSGMDAPYELQCGAAAALAHAAAAPAGTRGEALNALARRALPLCEAECGGLGVELLVHCAALAQASGLPWQNALMQARGAALHLLAAWPRDAFPPAPLLAATNMLLSHSDPEFLALGAEIETEILRRCTRGLSLDTARGSGIAAAAGWPGDTLFLVFAEGLRGDALEDARLGWQRELSERGVTCLFLAEAEQAALEQDRLYLPGAPAPHMLLAALTWLRVHTAAQYVVLVDDRCEIQPCRYLDSLSYRKHHYYGRRQHSAPGSMERRREHGAAGLDRSPEPSDWIDGAGAVSLSRAALEALAETTAMPEGQRLVHGSSRPFKMLGDLLALAGITPSDENYVSCQRETAPGGRTGRNHGDNTLLPGPTSPTMVFRPATTAERARQTPQSAWPPRVWPTCALPSLRHNTNQLEVLTGAAKASRLLAEPLAVVAVVRNEMTMLPHFLAHYRKLGVRAFLISDNCSDDGTLDYLAAQPDVMLFSSDTEYRCSHYGVSWQQAILGNFCLGKWVVLADADEFLVYQDCETRSIDDFVAAISARGGDAAPVYMIDMYPWGDLADARFDEGEPFAMAPYFDRQPLTELRFGGGNFSNSRNFVSALRHRVAPSRINAYVSQKVAVFRHAPWVRLGEGLHYGANLRVGETRAFFAHFKYHAGFKQKVLTEIRRRQHFNNAEEYELYAGMLAEGGGGFGAEGVSTRYEGSHSFHAILADLGEGA